MFPVRLESMDVRAAVEEMARAAEASDGRAPLDEAALMALADGSAEVHLAPHGFSLLHDGDLSVVVHPEHRGQGLGSELLRSADTLEGAVTAWSHGDHPAAARLAARWGWESVRDLWVMRRPTVLALPELEVPEGVQVRGFRDSDADEVVRVNAAAFAAHPEQGSMDAANLARRMAEPWFDPAGLLVAHHDGQDGEGLLGFHWTKQHDDRLGEVYVVGVDPAAQGRGLGRILTLAGLNHLAELGLDEVLLYVESDNTAAVNLYSGLGFTHADSDTHVQYVRRQPGGQADS